MKSVALFLFLLLILPLKLWSQDLESILDDESKDTTLIVQGTFNGTRLLNGHSIETRKKDVLEFLISHRFGRINSGFEQLFGLDDSNIRLAFEYAFTDDFTLAIGRSSFEKTFDGYAKYRILQQKRGQNAFPFGLTLFASGTAKTLKDYLPENKPGFGERLTYTGQVLMARKFSQGVSFQFAPTFIHYNSVLGPNDPQNMIALGFGTRIKISKRVSINGEYYYNINPFESTEVKNSLAFGVDIETGGHIFQLVFTNAVSMIEKGFIAETNGGFFKGDIHFGFNISRAFQIKKSK